MSEEESKKKYKTFSEDIGEKIDTYRNYDGNVSYCKAKKCPIVINLLNENEKFQQENAQLKEQISKAINHIDESINYYLKDEDLDTPELRIMQVDTFKERYLKPIKDILESNKED